MGAGVWQWQSASAGVAPAAELHRFECLQFAQAEALRAAATLPAEAHPRLAEAEAEATRLRAANDALRARPLAGVPRTSVWSCWGARSVPAASSFDSQVKLPAYEAERRSNCQILFLDRSTDPVGSG